MKGSIEEMSTYYARPRTLSGKEASKKGGTE